MNRLRAWAGWVGLALLWAGILPTPAGVLWRIGTFDESSAELRQWIHPQTGERQIDYTDAASDPVFVVGASDAARHWTAYQPGSANGAAGFREHPATVEFRLDAVPDRNVRLRVGLLSYSARLPVLQVALNGKRGWFHQHPRLAYSAGDPAVFFQPHYATSLITCELPRQWLRAGTNRLVLSAVDVPGEREDVRPSGFPWPGNSGLIYDALALEEIGPDEREEEAVSIRVEPTVFFRERGGKWFEEVDVFLRFRDFQPSGDVEFVADGFRTKASLREGGRDFGEVRVTFEIPAWEGVLQGRVARLHEKGADSFPVELAAGRRWQLWVVPHEHLDVGYTDHEAKVAELHSRVMDDAMAWSERVPGFSFTVDGQWVVEEYLAGRDEASRERLVRAMRERRIHVPVVHGSLFTGSASLEGLVRALYPSRAFARANGTPFDVAAITDVPSCSWSFASVLAASGVKYFLGASDAYRGPFLLRNRLNERSPHAWEGPDGGRVTTWYARHYHQVSSLFGLPPRPTLGRESLPRFLQAYDHAGYRARDVILYGTQVENVALQPGQTTLVADWNREYAYPRLRFGGFAEALAEIERQQGPLEVVRGDGGPYWEDGLAANARVTALARSNARRLPSAEKAATLAGLANPRFVPDAGDLGRAWRESLLIDEHTWHADCSVRDPQSEQARRQGEAKDARATDARRALDRVLQRSLSALGDAIPAGPGSILLFNPSSWARGGVVELEFGRGQSLVDAGTGEAVPMEVLRSGPVYQRVRMVTPEVPSLGYRVLRLRPAPAMRAGVATPERGWLENRWFRVKVDPAGGGVRSWVDRATGREWIATNHVHGLGQWLYVTGGDDLPNRIVQYSTVSPIPELGVHAASGGEWISSESTPLGPVAKWRSHAPNCPEIETEVWLPEARREVHLTVRVRKTATTKKEAAYVAFPFAVTKPVFRYATANGWVDPTRDLLPGAGREWFAVQDWLGVSDAAGTVLVSSPDAPLVTLGDIVRGTWPAEFGERAATVYSYVMSNYTPEGYAAAQGGEFTFRYVLTVGGPFEGGAAARFGEESATQIETGEITRADKLEVGAGPWDPVAESGLRVAAGTVRVSAWKRAEDGRGWIVRLVETAGRTGEAALEMPRANLVRVARCNAVEDELEPVPVEAGGRVRIEVPAHGIVTLRWEGGAR